MKRNGLETPQMSVAPYPDAGCSIPIKEALRKWEEAQDAKGNPRAADFREQTRASLRAQRFRKGRHADKPV